MGTQRAALRIGDLARIVAAAGETRRPSGAERLRGGTRKGVYRVVLDDGDTCVVYVWSPAEDFWPAGPAPTGTDPYSPPPGAGTFEAAHRELAGLSVRVPQLRHLDRSRTLVDADVAVVEDVRGGTLERLAAQEPARAHDVLLRLGTTLRTLHARRRGSAGHLLAVGAPSVPVERHLFDRAVRHLAACSGQVPAIAAARDRIGEVLHERFGAVAPRRDATLVHGELGPDHVLVDDRGEPVLIDIEGCMFFDVEWEHAFLELRFGAAYDRYLRADHLDAARLGLYRPALYLSLVEGPLRLATGDFPGREAMLAIAAENVRRLLRECAQAPITTTGPGRGDLRPW